MRPNRIGALENRSYSAWRAYLHTEQEEDGHREFMRTGTPGGDPCGGPAFVKRVEHTIGRERLRTRPGKPRRRGKQVWCPPIQARKPIKNHILDPANVSQLTTRLKRRVALD